MNSKGGVLKGGVEKRKETMNQAGHDPIKEILSKKKEV